MANNNSFNGGTNIGSGNSAGRDQIINVTHPQTEQPVAKYDVEPVWRSPITMAILTWISFIPTIGTLFSGFKIFEPMANLFLDSSNSTQHSGNTIYFLILIFIICLLLLVLILTLRNITKHQTRYPLMFNYAISGIGKRLNIEKIIMDCPECGGELKYYNKPYKWIEYRDEKGNLKSRKVTEKKPALECKRNKDHYWYVDPAGTKI